MPLAPPGPFTTGTADYDGDGDGDVGRRMAWGTMPATGGRMSTATTATFTVTLVGDVRVPR